QNTEPTLHLVEPTGSGGRVMEMDVRVTRQPVVSFRFVRVQIVEDHMNLPSRMVTDHLIHEIEKLAPSAPRIEAVLNLPGRHIQSRKQGGSSVSLVIMAEPPQGPASGNLQVPLSPLQGLDMRFFIHRHNQGMVGRVQVKPNNVSCFGSKLRVGADTPT